MKTWKWNLALAVIVSAALFVGFANGQAANQETASPEQAQALESQGKLPEAAEAWRSITRQNPSDAAAFASLGVVLARQEKYQEAASAYRQAIKLDPKLPGVQLDLGLSEFKQGEFRAAIEAFLAVLAAEPNNSQAVTLLGLSYYGVKEFAEAEKYLKMAAA